MTGFDNGTLQGGVFFQAKQFGSILRGFGPPVPQAGVVGDLYVDVQSWFLYNKRAGDNTDPWGHYLFQVPATYQNTLKWFSPSPPTPDIGVQGDYCLVWAGFPNYGLQPSIYGPKGLTNWLENGTGPTTQIDPAFAGSVLPVGVSDEGPTAAFSSSTQIIVVGLVDEYILSIPTPTTAGTLVYEIGMQLRPATISVTLNSLYTAEDTHAL